MNQVIDCIRWVILRAWHRGEEPRINFRRIATGEEVDLLVEPANGLLPVEVKASATPTPAMARDKTISQSGIQPAARRPDGYVLHTGDVVLPLGQGVTALRFSFL